MDWMVWKQRIAAGMTLLLIGSAWAFATTRASSEDLVALAVKHEADRAEEQARHAADMAEIRAQAKITNELLIRIDERVLQIQKAQQQ